MTSSEPLPAGYDPKIGSTLVELSSGETFRVLCSCPSSTPVKFTRRFIQRNPSLYGIPKGETNGNS